MTTLASTLQRLGAIKRVGSLISVLLMILRGVAVGALVISVWSLVDPTDQLAQLTLGLIAFVLTAFLPLLPRWPWRLRRQGLGAESLALTLEIKYGERAPRSIDSSHPDTALPEEWMPLIDDELREAKRFEARRNWTLASALILPIALSAIALPRSAPSFKLALTEAVNVVARLGRGATLKVIQGSVSDPAGKALPLSTRHPLDLELLAQNLVEIDVNGGGFTRSAPAVELRKADAQGGSANAPIFQSFQMAPATDGKTDEENNYRHVVAFAVTENVDLYIPALDGSTPYAHIKVRQLPIPKVTLSAMSELEDPWPDDQPLSLHIQVKAENPLQTVRLVIKSEQRASKELVANVVTDDMHELNTDYRLLLEQYVENDLAEVEIVAEAVDRALPTPLVGHSETLKINTASAYGRYRQSLQTLRELKTLVDNAMSKQERSLPKEANDLANKAADQSERSPFFDGLDRVQIHRFASRLEELAAETQSQAQTEKIMELSQTLNDFLFEHEVLDDRERDRDFFVAARALSRLVEQESSKRPVALKTVGDRLKKFLDDRQERWSRRVERLRAPYKPARWPEIRDKKPFHSTVTQIQNLDEKAKTSPEARSEQLTLLSKAVVDYRVWIEDLESKEDKMREEEERQRQEGLASARDTLRELQKRQGEISAELDRADEQQRQDLDNKWPTTRMKQNTNAKETHRLDGQMRSLSPTAASRIQAAVQAMEGTTAAGNQGNYTTAETNADLAGRLLRQAESAAQQSQQKRRSRGRRRRVTGDNYYGQSVVGGDVEIKREYQVDRRYREDILDEVQSSNYDDENRALLENYLRQVVR